MAWYNGGVWTGLDATQIPHMMASIANGISERSLAIGLAPPDIATPAGGEKSTGFVFGDFLGMELYNTAHMLALETALRAVFTPGGSDDAVAVSAIRLMGWCRDPADKSDDLSNYWSGGYGSVLTELKERDGIDYTLASDYTLDANYWLGLKAILDVMLYPVFAIGSYSALEGSLTPGVSAEENGFDEHFRASWTDVITIPHEKEPLTAAEAYDRCFLGPYNPRVETGSTQWRSSAHMVLYHMLGRTTHWERMGPGNEDDLPTYLDQIKDRAESYVLLEGIEPEYPILGVLVSAHMTYLLRGSYPAGGSKVSAMDADFAYVPATDGTDYINYGHWVTAEVSGVVPNVPSAITSTLAPGSDGYPFSRPPYERVMQWPDWEAGIGWLYNRRWLTGTGMFWAAPVFRWYRENWLPDDHGRYLWMNPDAAGLLYTHASQYEYDTESTNDQHWLRYDYMAANGHSRAYMDIRSVLTDQD